ncbi:MAG: VWA domain-containing protein [Pyrinomonadaceae bacterium]|nr:VWA domain-containing protein [Pyrinomonadaceae bacterium]
MHKFARKLLLGIGCMSLAAVGVFAQSGHSARKTENLDGSIISVTAKRAEGKKNPILAKNLFLYENAIEQTIKNFSYDPSPARIVLLVDNSQTVPLEVYEMRDAVMEFVYEIYDGDQLFVIAYDTSPEIIQEWTDDASSLETSLKTLRKKGNPHLFDAVSATVSEVLVPLMPGTRKTAIVVIGDGLDRGSVTPYDKMIDRLQNNNIVVYALSVKDRTGGAYRRYSPKAGAVIKGITEETGGLAFKASDAKVAAKTICDELRLNRYLLSYFPTNTSSFDARRLFIVPDEGITVRHKKHQPPNIK